MAVLSFSLQQSIKKIRAFKVGSSVDLEDYETIATEIENSQMVKLLSPYFWQMIKVGVSETIVEQRWTDLMVGVSYQNGLGQTIIHRGLNFVIAHFNFARYLRGYNVRETQKGLMAAKETESSTPASSKQIEALAVPVEEIAMNEFQLIKEFICLKNNVYPEAMWAKTTNPTKQVINVLQSVKYTK